MEKNAESSKKDRGVRGSSKMLITFILLLMLLLAGNVYFARKYFNSRNALQQFKPEVVYESDENVNVEILKFFKFFIEKVLEADGEVDFETRLDLENAVRDLHDEEILEQWKKFTASESEEQSQEEVKNLMKLLVSKIRSS